MASSTPYRGVVETQGNDDGSESPLVNEEYEIFGQKGKSQLLQVNIPPKACITTDIECFSFSGGLVRLRSVPEPRILERCFMWIGLSAYRQAIFENESSTTKAYIGLSPRSGGQIMRIPLRDTGPILIISGSFLCGLSGVEMSQVRTMNMLSNFHPCVFRISGQGTAFIGAVGLGCFRRLIEGESIRVAMTAVLGFTEGCTVASGGKGSDTKAWKYFKYPSMFGIRCGWNSALVPYLVFTGPGVVYMQSPDGLPMSEKLWSDEGRCRQGIRFHSSITLTCVALFFCFYFLCSIFIVMHALSLGPALQAMQDENAL